MEICFDAIKVGAVRRRLPTAHGKVPVRVDQPILPMIERVYIAPPRFFQAQPLALCHAPQHSYARFFASHSSLLQHQIPFLLSLRNARKHVHDRLLSVNWGRKIPRIYGIDHHPRPFMCRNALSVIRGAAKAGAEFRAADSTSTEFAGAMTGAALSVAGRQPKSPLATGFAASVQLNRGTQILGNRP
jgi:hypothetical protein